MHHCVYEDMWMCASQCVLLGGLNGGTSDRRCISFSRGRETSECDEARESALSSKWTPPLSHPSVTFFFPIFTTLTVTSYSQASSYLFWPDADRLSFFCFFPFFLLSPSCYHLLSSIQLNILQPDREAKSGFHSRWQLQPIRLSNRNML